MKKLLNFIDNWGTRVTFGLVLIIFLKTCTTNTKIEKVEKELSKKTVSIDSTLNSIDSKIITEDNIDRLTSLFYGEDNIQIKEKTPDVITKDQYKMISDNKFKIGNRIMMDQEKKEWESDKPDVLPNDPILLKEMLEKLDPNF